MSTLICNLPAVQVWVRREYLRDHVDGHGEYVPGVWLSAKSIPGRAFYNSLTPAEPLKPDFRVSTQYYQVEAEDGARYGDTDAYFYEESSCEPK